jgi:outer membrane protein assembly factor BamA
MIGSSSSRSGLWKWLRQGAKFLLVLVALGVLICTALVVSLRFPAGRGAVLRWAGSAIEEATGIHLRARDFALSLRAGEITLYELALRAGGSDSQPFLVVPVAGGGLSWRSLLSNRPQIHTLRFQEPLLDLGAPLPQASENGEADTNTLLPSLDIHRFELVDGSIRAGEAPGELDMWWDSWRADRLTLVGSLTAGDLEFQVQSARLFIDSHRRPGIAVDLAAQLTVSEDGEFSIDRLELSSDALELRIDGRGRLEATAPVELSIDLQSDLARLVPDLTSSGQLEASGDLTFTPSPEATLVGEVRVSAQGFPAELLDPVLANAGWEGRVQLEETWLDLEADLNTHIAFDNLSTDPGNDLASGEARLTWRRQDEPLVLASIRSLQADSASGGKGITVAVDVQILPRVEGSRRLEGRLFAPRWTELRSLELQDVRFELRQAELRDLTSELGLPPVAFGGFQPAGSISLFATADGPIASPELELKGSWQLGQRRLAELSANSSAGSNLIFQGEVLPDSPGVRSIEGGIGFSGLDNVLEGTLENLRIEVDLPDLDSALGRLEELLELVVPDPELRHDLSATLSRLGRDRLTGSLRSSLNADGPLTAPDVDFTGRWAPTDTEHIEVVASYDGKVLKLDELSGALAVSGPGAETLRFGAQGQVEIETPVRNAALDLQIFSPIEGIDRIEVNAELDGGTLSIAVTSPSVPGRIEALVPLAVLRDQTQLSETLENLPLIFDPGALELELNDLGLENTAEILLGLVGNDEDNLEVAGFVDASVSMDPSNLAAALGSVEISELSLTFRDTRIESDSTLRVDLQESHLALQPARLRVIDLGSEAPLDLALTADLNPEWKPEIGFGRLLEALEMNLEGTIDSSLLTPFLAGGVASGPVTLEAAVEGSLDDLEAKVRLDGRQASLVLPGRYHTRIEAPELELIVDNSGAELRASRLRLNRGTVELSGTWSDDDVLRLAAEFQDVRYRLDLGLTVQLNGNLDLTWPREGRRRLAGMIDVERGSLRRNISLERELIRMFNPRDLTGTDTSFLATVDLDLNLVTSEGVRIKNNLADLRADWSLIRIRGTLAEPTIAGQIDVDPGGLLTAYGQTVRIDQGALIFSGVPGEPPRMDFETTSSIEDPRLRQQWRNFWSTGPGDTGPGGGFWDQYQPQGANSAFQMEELTTSLSSYFQNRFARAISGGAPRVELSVQPLPLMGETDTTARVTMAYHLSPQISYILSQNPREAEGRTDILSLHNFAMFPSLQGQIFRNDEGHHGVTVQQTLEFGGGRQPEDAMARVGSLDLTAPKGVRKRTVRRATGLRRGQPVAKGADFDIEIDMLEAMTQKGYPAAMVGVELEPAARNRVDIGITVEPGARVNFEFEGENPPRAARRDIIALYRPTGMDESRALESIRRETVRALRARGFLDPHVETTMEHEDPGNPASTRTIRVHSEGGRRVHPQTLVFPGLPTGVEAGLATLFSSRLARVELASGDPVADRFLGQSLQAVGYPEAQVLSRELSSDGSVLTVQVEPGPRQHLAAVEILGVGPEERSELQDLLEIAPGDPLRLDLISRASLIMEDNLREQGFADADVGTRLEPSSIENADEINLFFDVETGLQHRIGEVRTAGLANSSPAWVKGIAGLENGELLTDSGVARARRQLARTGVFQRIAVRGEGPSEDDVDLAQESRPITVLAPITLELEEHPRYRVAYGLRAESSREAGVVVDMGDLNFLGRGQTLGLRLIAASLERNARLYWSIPRVRKTNKNLEFFVEGRREKLDTVVGKTAEAWAQVTFPWGKKSVNRLYTVYKQSLTEDLSQPEVPAQRVTSPFSGWQLAYDSGERSFFETSTEKRTLFVGLDLSFTSESLGSDYTGYGLFAQLKPQIPLRRMGESALVWVQSYRTGLKEADDDVELPFFDRLFAGGEFSVRGYPTNSLGPRDENGTPLGGEAMFVTNQELRFPVWSILSGVVFFDAGNVWSTRDAVESSLFKSLGAGLRADSPVGPLRIDIAFPLDRREGDPEYKVYFGLGQAF